MIIFVIFLQEYNNDVDVISEPYSCNSSTFRTVFMFVLVVLICLTFVAILLLNSGFSMRTGAINTIATHWNNSTKNYAAEARTIGYVKNTISMNNFTQNLVKNNTINNSTISSFIKDDDRLFSFLSLAWGLGKRPTL